MIQDLYTSGEYLEKNPLWHADESPWKARSVLEIMARNHLAPRTICDVGCGVGEVLRLVQAGTDPTCHLVGYDISPQAIDLCQRRANEHLEFRLGDIRKEGGRPFDVLLVLDVIEHLEDYFGFLRDLRPRAEFKIIHIPLDISVRSVLLGRLVDYRASYGHVHYFTKEVALQTLRDVGYDIQDYLYTSQTNPLKVVWNEHRHSGARTLARKLTGFMARSILGLPGRGLFAVHADLAVRVLGGWRLLVLAR
jgi:SAM-dependent methyltransferase